MAGPATSGFRFEPETIAVKAGQDCSDIVFKLKGFDLPVEVRYRNVLYKPLFAGKGIALELRKNVTSEDEVLQKVYTDEHGKATFTDLKPFPEGFRISIVRELNEDSEPMFMAEWYDIECRFEQEFRCQRHSRFMINGVSFYGKVNGLASLSADEQANLKVRIMKGHNSSRVQTVGVNSKGIYRAYGLVAGRYQAQLLLPDTIQDESRLSFKPQEIQILNEGNVFESRVS